MPGINMPRGCLFNELFGLWGGIFVAKTEKFFIFASFNFIVNELFKICFFWA
jgi:hypothetical protein